MVIRRLNGINSAYIHFFKNRQPENGGKKSVEKQSKETAFPLTSYPANYYINSSLSSDINEKLPGYEREKLKIEKLLIDLINKNKVGVPSGIILAEDEPSTGKAFVDYIKTQTNANVVSLNTSPENFIKDTLITLNEAKENYMMTGKRTIITVKNSEELLSPKNMNNVSHMNGWLLVSQCVPLDEIDNAYATTFLFETGNPQALAKGIWDNVEDIVYLPLRTKENNAEILVTALGKYVDVLSDDDFDLLVQKLTPNTQKGAYSDAKIFKTIENALKEYKQGKYKLAHVLSSAIDNEKCDISPQNVVKSKKTEQWLIKYGLIDEIKPDIDEEKIQRILEYPDNTYVQFLNKRSENSDLKYKTNIQTVETATQAKLRNENKIMQIAKIACKDILENDKTISAVEKEILINQQKNKLFLKLVSNNFKDDKLSKIENNVLNTIAELSGEVSDLIFEKEGYRMAFSDCEYSDDSKSNYILDLLYSAQTDNTFNKSAEIKDVAETFYNAKKSGCTASVENSWEKMVYIASEYFEFHLRSVLTNRNVELLNSINDNLSPDDSPQLHKLAFDKNLTIEEREFIVRYKDDKNFQKLLNNPDVKIKDVVEKLLLFELLNIKNDFATEKNNLKEMMSDKFKQIIKDENSEKGLLNDFFQANKKFVEKMKDLIKELDDFKTK